MILIKNNDPRGRSRRKIVRYRGLLPPPAFPGRQTVVLDMDNTLLNAVFDAPPERYDFALQLLGGLFSGTNVYVQKRPGVDELLAALAARFEVVVFTAGLEEYASPVLDRLDPLGLISHRLYRDSCMLVMNRQVKDLSKLGRDLRRVVIVDDKVTSYMLQPRNGIPIRRFDGDMEDRELWRLMEFVLERVDGVKDVRDAVKQYRSV